MNTERRSHPVYAGGKDEPEYVVTDVSVHNGITVKVLRPVLSPEEAKIEHKKILNDFVSAMTEHRGDGCG